MLRDTALGASPTLTSLLRRAQLTCVDIGARTVACPEWRVLAPVTHCYIADPDAVEAARLAQDTTWQAVTVIPEAIAARSSPATLYLTRQPGMSSLLKPDDRVTRRFYLHRKFEVVATRSVPVVALDAAADRYGFTDACFVKVDTQGTELEILQSGEHLLQRSVVGVYVECAFRAFYAGQPLFGDVDRYLRAQGFELCSLSRTNLRRAGYKSTPYSRRMTAWAHCLYVREPDTVAAATLIRVLALALAFQQYDLARETAAAIEASGTLAADVGVALLADVRQWLTQGQTAASQRALKLGVAADGLRQPSWRDRKHLE